MQRRRTDFHPAFEQVVPHPYKKGLVGFGRVPSIDFRDRKHLVKPKADARINSRYWSAGRVLDQGSTPQCVAYSGEGFLMAGPVKNLQWGTPNELYKLCQQNDEWPGEDYDGTSVRALFKVFQQLGYVSEYNWAFDVVTAFNFVLSHGPMVFGIDWYTGMMDTDAQGYIHATGNVEGGHAILVIGANKNRRNPNGTVGAFRLQNSWSTVWGQQGRCWLSFDDAQKLIQSYGEAATSTELVIKSQERAPDEFEREEPQPRQTNIADVA